MGERDERGRELVLASNEFAYVQDETKGQIGAFVGPTKSSLAGTDRTVIFDPNTKRFVRVSMEQCIQPFKVAPEGWYIILKNPTEGDKNTPPPFGQISSGVKFNVGHKINIPGPVSIPLWPGQLAKVIKGHHLRSNQYLVIRVYDQKAAEENSGLLADLLGKKVSKKSKEESESKVSLNLVMGNLFIIKGTDTSFFIPPTGIEVIPESNENYIRDAVTLESLEYCILLDEAGNKRYVTGPAVVFPTHEEKFIEHNGTRKFKAIELNEISGIYVKVIKEYEEKDIKYKVGDELFITGKDQMIYYPRVEHAIIKYEGQERHHAIAIPKGEGRYILDRLNGSINLINGPNMYLADPRKEVVIKRVLTVNQCELWFPGSKAALAFNTGLAKILESQDEPYVTSSSFDYMQASDTRRSLQSGDSIDRKNKFTPPRSIVLDTKYEGAVSIDVWTGYAIQVVPKVGDRKVVVGPKSVLLNYDETLEILELSTGKPKTTDEVLKTVYLRVLNNQISDIVSATTADLCDIEVKLSYRVSFIDENEKWFSVENYVKFLCDRMRSRIKRMVSQVKIQDLFTNYIDVVRNAVLGMPDETTHKHPGTKFEENNMFVHDVEVLNIKVGDQVVAKELIKTQQDIIKDSVQLTQKTQLNEISLKLLKLGDILREAQKESNIKKISSEIEEENKRAEALEVEFLNESNNEKRSKNLQIELANLQKNITEITVETKTLEDGRAQVNDRFHQDLEIKTLKEETISIVDRLKAISPELAAAINTLGDKDLAARMAESIGPMSLLGGGSVAEVFQKAFAGTPVAEVIRKYVTADEKKK